MTTRPKMTPRLPKKDDFRMQRARPHAALNKPDCGMPIVPSNNGIALSNKDMVLFDGVTLRRPPAFAPHDSTSNKQMYIFPKQNHGF